MDAAQVLIVLQTVREVYKERMGEEPLLMRVHLNNPLAKALLLLPVKPYLMDVSKTTLTIDLYGLERYLCGFNEAGEPWTGD